MKNRKVYVTEPMKVGMITDDFNERIIDSHDVIIKNKYSHISAGTELACLTGKESFFKIPDTPGYTAVGEVIEKGEAVNFNMGDLVFSMGPHAEYFKVNTADRWHGVCVKLPQGIKPDEAAFAHMAAIAMTSIRVSDVELGDNVLVTGLGAIGNLAAQLAQLQGGKVIAVDINDQRIDMAKKSGLEITVNTEKQNLEKEINKVTNEQGVSTFIDATGVPAVIEQNMQHVSFKGEVVLLGTPRAEYQADLTNIFQKVHLLPHSLTMKGALEFIYPSQENEFLKHSIERNIRIILNLINENKLRVAPFYSHKMNPADAQKAYDGLREKKDEYIGVVFDWN